MKKIYILLLFFSFSFNAVYSQKIHATNDVIYLYDNELDGRYWLDDTIGVGFDPHSYTNTWHGVIAMDTARKLPLA